MTDTAPGPDHLANQASARGRFLPLTVLLISPDASIHDLDLALREEQTIDWFARTADGQLGDQQAQPALDAQLQVGIRRAKRGVPSWRPFLRSLGADLSEDDVSDTEALVIAVRSEQTDSGEQRWVLYCFGGISRSVPTDLIDSRFGIVTALNKQSLGDSLEPWRTVPADVRRRKPRGSPRPHVRYVQAEVHDGHQHKMTAVSADPSPLRGLRFDQVSDLLRGLAIRTDDELMRDLAGNKALKFSTYLETFDDFVDLADYLVDLRCRDNYKVDWEWIDNIVPVPTRAQADELLDRLTDQIGTPAEPAIDLMMPEWDAADAVASKRFLFALPGQRGTPATVLLRWEQVRKWILDERGQRERRRPLLRSELRVCVEGYEADVQRVQIAELMIAEMPAPDGQYIVSEGEVYRVERSYLDRLDAALAEIPWSSFPFPPYTGGTEPEYLKNVVEKSGRRVAVMDQRNINLEGETPFEPCDIVTDDGLLVFAKLKGKSSLFSHLCTQAVSAAELLSRVPDARAQFLDRLVEATTNSSILDSVTDELEKLERHEPGVRLCLMLLGTWRGGRPDVRKLPLISRLILYKTAQRISAAGYVLELCSPPVGHGRLP